MRNKQQKENATDNFKKEKHGIPRVNLSSPTSRHKCEEVRQVPFSQAPFKGPPQVFQTLPFIIFCVTFVAAGWTAPLASRDGETWDSHRQTIADPTECDEEEVTEGVRAFKRPICPMLQEALQAQEILERWLPTRRCPQTTKLSGRYRP